jgi:hypothetical protein
MYRQNHVTDTEVWCTELHPRKYSQVTKADWTIQNSTKTVLTAPGRQLDELYSNNKVVKINPSLATTVQDIYYLMGGVVHPVAL